ncbi:MAG TPA: hypothetical protein VGZ29_06010 [Terriglobia bacterium]|nr:hypothetical protein [Terriglobia bacterium]
MRNKERLIRAAYTHSDELGKEVEALAASGPTPERLGRLRRLVNEQFGNDAELVYGTVLSVLYPPN